jgi:hypothetical protein
MAKEIQLNGTQNVTVVTREEVIIETDKVNIISITDDGKKVYCKVSFFHTSGLKRDLILWEGQDYNNIGNWTDDDVENRVKELLNVT